MDYMKYYWGGMAEHGADTFWELYNPENPQNLRMAEVSSTATVMHGAVHRLIFSEIFYLKTD